MNGIPKIIHYCWFGNSSKPKDIQKYISKWHKLLPDYEIKEWNESNCDLDNEITYVKEAYQAKKYAFVSDYIRLKRLYEFGGVYFDTDIDVLKNFDKKLEGALVVLCQQSQGDISTAFMASVKHHPLFKECLDHYQDRHFINEDGSYDTKSINNTMDPFVMKYGVDLQRNEFQKVNNGIFFYPMEYFSAFDIFNWHPVITDNTYTVHNMASSWRPVKVKVKILFIKIAIRIIGVKNYDKIRSIIRRK